MATNWVRARAECTRESVFDALYKQAQEDVDEANAICLAGDGRRFVVKEDAVPNTAAAFSVKRCFGNDCDASVLFQRFDLEIRITRSNNGLFNVRPQWNSRDLSCDLYIGERPHKVWQVSQAALEPLFFGS